MFALGAVSKIGDSEPSEWFKIQLFPTPMQLRDASSGKAPLMSIGVSCPECKGGGTIQSQSLCSGCRGTGFHYRRIANLATESCPNCGGSGRMSSWTEERLCSSCGGSGRAHPWTEEDKPDGPCRVCGGEAVSERFTDCGLCHATGRITTRQRNRRWLKIVALKLLKVIGIIALFYLLLAVFVYVTKRL
jgi:RecJ-like exonuclease